MARIKSYHFSLGDSSTGPIGFCARILAPSPERALELLREALPEELPADELADHSVVEYIRVYLNQDAISVLDIDEVDMVIGSDEEENRHADPDAPRVQKRGRLARGLRRLRDRHDPRTGPIVSDRNGHRGCRRRPTQEQADRDRRVSIPMLGLQRAMVPGRLRRRSRHQQRVWRRVPAPAIGRRAVPDRERHRPDQRTVHRMDGHPEACGDRRHDRQHRPQAAGANRRRRYRRLARPSE